MKQLPNPLSKAMARRIAQALIKPVTALVPSRKKLGRYRVTTKIKGREGFTLDGETLTPAIAFEMAWIAIQDEQFVYSGISVNGEPWEQDLVAVAIDLLNRHFKNRPNLHVNNATDIAPSNQDIATMVEFYYSPSLQSQVRNLPKNFTRYGERF